MWWARTKCSAKIFAATESRTLLHTLSIQAIFHNDIIKFEISFISTEAVWKRWIIILWKLKCCFSNDKFCSKLQKPSKTKSHSQNCHWFCFEMYLTLEFGKFQNKKGLKQENLRKIELEFVSISWVINHMTCYNSSALIGWKFILKKAFARFALQPDCWIQPMRALEFITGHVYESQAYTYKFQPKTTQKGLSLVIWN